MNSPLPQKLYTNGLFIPSHRVLPEAVLESAINEAGIAKVEFDIDLPIIIIDDAKTSEVSQANYKRIKAYQNSWHEGEIIWISKEYQNKIVSRISSDLNIPKHLLESNQVNYGVIFNILFIIGKILGISTYHRRDSDVKTQTLNNKAYAPITLELTHIRQKKNGIKLNIVGGNYLDAEGEKPDSSLRLDECMKTEEFLQAFLHCVPEEDIEVVTELKRLLAEVSPSPLTAAHNDEVLSSNDMPDETGSDYVDCGNVCFTDDIYSLIPSAPNDCLIGADYHFFNVARILNYGLLSHKCSVLHDKIEMRSDQSDKLAYWRNMFYFCDAEAFHFKAYTVFKQNCCEIAPHDKTSKRIRQVFIQALQAAKQQISWEQRRERLQRFSTALSITGEASYQKIAKEAERDAFEHVLLKGVRDLDNYISLLQRWHEVLDYLPLLTDSIRHAPETWQ